MTLNRLIDCRIDGMIELIDGILCISDVVTIEKTGEHFRLIYDVKGRFTIHRISAEEAKVITKYLLVVNCPF